MKKIRTLISRALRRGSRTWSTVIALAGALLLYMLLCGNECGLDNQQGVCECINKFIDALEHL